MRICVFGLNFKSKKHLAQLLGTPANYGPRREKNKRLATRETLDEADILYRLNLTDPNDAKAYLLKLLSEEQNNASANN